MAYAGKSSKRMANPLAILGLVEDQRDDARRAPRARSSARLPTRSGVRLLDVHGRVRRGGCRARPSLPAVPVLAAAIARRCSSKPHSSKPLTVLPLKI